MAAIVTRILGAPIATVGMDEALHLCAAQATSRSGGFVCFANVHSVTEGSSDARLQEAFERAFLCVADGLPLVWVSRFRSEPIKSRVCGPDFMELFLERNREVRHGFIGGLPGVAEALARRFGLDATCYSPPIREFSEIHACTDWSNFLEQNGDAPVPDVVWVGLGAPKQELWMNAVSAVAPGVLFLGVGAAFDFLTERKRRAPLWMQEAGLEWLYRLFQEPRRLWRRYFVTNTRFVLLILAELIGGHREARK